jgi:hypothetical protein
MLKRDYILTHNGIRYYEVVDTKKALPNSKALIVKIIPSNNLIRAVYGTSVVPATLIGDHREHLECPKGEACETPTLPVWLLVPRNRSLEG